MQLPDMDSVLNTLRWVGDKYQRNPDAAVELVNVTGDADIHSNLEFCRNICVLLYDCKNTEDLAYFRSLLPESIVRTMLSDDDLASAHSIL